MSSGSPEAQSPVIETRALDDNERAQLPFDFTDAVYNLTDQTYDALFQGQRIWVTELTDEWQFDDSTRNPLSPGEYNRAHPGIEYVLDFDDKTGFASYRNRRVRWNPAKHCWIYTNNRPVDFDDDEVASSLLSEPSILDTPEAEGSTFPGSFNAPTPVTPTPRRTWEPLEPVPEDEPEPPRQPVPFVLPTPVTQGAQASTRAETAPPRPQTPTRPPQRSPLRPRTTLPVMATSATTNPPPNKDRILGATPEPFDGKASSAEMFWNNLENYYYLNDAIFTDQGKKVAAALTHFKLGTPAGDWARDRARTALNQTPINYGTWKSFKDDFEAHFIPAESALEASSMMHSLRQGSRPFNEWYQEWSTYANRANVDANTKMYAFRRMLNRPLHERLLGISPAPTTLAQLVEKAREFDRLWHLYQTPAFKGGSFSKPARTRGLQTSEDDPLQINLYQGEPGERQNFGRNPSNSSNTPRGPLSKEERERRFANKLCLYCGKAGHMARECRAKKSAQGRASGNTQRSTPRVRGATIQEVEETSSETPLPVSTLYTWREELASRIPRSKSANPDF